jgi:hypothetical protein
MPPATPEESGLKNELLRLRDWIAGQVELPCLIGAAGEPDTEHRPDSYVGVQTVLIAPPPYRSDQQVSRVNAQVLVVANGPDLSANADVIADLMLHALAAGDWDLVQGQPDVGLWTALGRPPVPAFMVSIPVTLAIPREQAPPVRRPLDVQGGAIRRVHGRVLAADGTPLAGARLRLHPNGVPTTTGHDGRWALSLPDVLVRLDVWARGASLSYSVPPSSESVSDGSAQAGVDIVLAAIGATGPPVSTSGSGPDQSTPRADREAAMADREETEN